MGNSKIDTAALFIALVTGAFILWAFRPYGFLTGIGGIVLLLVLFAYDQEGYRSMFQSLAYGSVCGFALLLLIAAYFHARTSSEAAITQAYAQYLPVAWACATIIFMLIDRARMTGRTQPVRSQATFGIAPPPRYEAPRPQPVAAPPPPPVQPEPVPSEPVEAFAPDPVAPAPEPVAAPPERAVPLPRGKETEIYINLVGEGLALMRTVRAEHVGKDFYLITEPMPEGESWEFTTGQIVRCRKKNLSHGKGLVAVEEAPRAS